MVMGTLAIPTLLCAEAARIVAIGEAFRLTWYMGFIANAFRLYASFTASSCPKRSSWKASFFVFVYAVVSTVPILHAMEDIMFLPALVVFAVCVGTIQRAMTRSFTFGEAIIVSELFAVLFHFIIVSVVLDYTPLLVLTSKLRTVIVIGLFSSIAGSAANILLSQALGTWDGDKNDVKEDVYKYRGSIHTIFTMVLSV